MDEHNAHIGAHQTVFVEQHGDGGVDTQLGEGVGQQEGQHEHLTAPILEPGDGIRSRDTQQHGDQGRHDCHDEGLYDGGHQTVLREYVFPPFQAPGLGEHGRRRIFIGKGKHQHIQQRPVEKQDEHRQQNELQKLPFSHRIIETPWIEHFEHQSVPLLFSLSSSFPGAKQKAKGYRTYLSYRKMTGYLDSLLSSTIRIDFNCTISCPKKIGK